MIYTVTINPAIDYVMYMDNLKPGQINRSNKERIFYGGKGINVSFVLSQLGIKSKALGFIAGFTGEQIEKSVVNSGIDTDFIKVKNGMSRINVKVKSDLETELNGQGPEISKGEIYEFLNKIECLRNGDCIVLAGSIPSNMDSDIYEQILARASDKNIKSIIDATGKLLLDSLKYTPFLIKPNIDELGELFGVKIKNVDEVIKYAERLKKMGAKNVLVSMAEKGSILIDEFDKRHMCNICKGKVVNSVGAGDSMVAGFLVGALENDYDYALKLGTACGAATVFSEGLGKREDIFNLLKQLTDN